MEDIIWTSNAMRQVRAFGIPQTTAIEAFRRPTETGELTRGIKKSVRILGDREIGFTFRKNDQGNWVVLSCWARQLP